MQEKTILFQDFYDCHMNLKIRLEILDNLSEKDNTNLINKSLINEASYLLKYFEIVKNKNMQLNYVKNFIKLSRKKIEDLYHEYNKKASMICNGKEFEGLLGEQSVEDIIEHILIKENNNIYKKIDIETNRILAYIVLKSENTITVSKINQIKERVVEILPKSILIKAEEFFELNPVEDFLTDLD